MTANPDTASTVKTAGITLTIGCAGAAAAWLAGFPAPALTGSAIIISVAGLAGLQLDVLPPIRNTAFLIIGMTMGAGVTPEVLETARQWPATFIGLAISIVLTFWLAIVVLRKFWRLDRSTAILSSTPGHLSYILGLSAEIRSNIAVISVIQSIRLLALTLIVPFAIMAGAALTGFALSKLRVPAALLLGGMFVSTVTHLFGWAQGGVPVWLSWPAFAVMGTLIGTRFSGISLQTLAASAVAGLATTLLAFGI